MLVLNNGKDVVSWCSAYRRAGLSIGFVPTMGALHEGHLSLVRTAKRECEKVVVSIFVNPLQFGPAEDFSKYPRPFERDRRLCEEEGVDLLYHGATDDFYPAGFSTRVRVEKLTEGLCGRSRPVHFEGVCTVVAKLLLRILPHKAYFGQKDYQQAMVIDRLVRDLDIPAAVVMLPIVREEDGLAVSSRNVYLSPRQRRSATALFRGLSAAERSWRRGERRAGALKRICSKVITEAPEARIDYIEAVCPETVAEQPDAAQLTEGAVLAVAVFFGKTRLIDNVVLAV